jgi:hypothetical protein
VVAPPPIPKATWQSLLLGVDGDEHADVLFEVQPNKGHHEQRVLGFGEFKPEQPVLAVDHPGALGRPGEGNRVLLRVYLNRLVEEVEDDVVRDDTVLIIDIPGDLTEAGFFEVSLISLFRLLLPAADRADLPENGRGCHEGVHLHSPLLKLDDRERVRRLAILGGTGFRLLGFLSHHACLSKRAVP